MDIHRNDKKGGRDPTCPEPKINAILRADHPAEVEHQPLARRVVLTRNREEMACCTSQRLVSPSFCLKLLDPTLGCTFQRSFLLQQCPQSGSKRAMSLLQLASPCEQSNYVFALVKPMFPSVQLLSVVFKRGVERLRQRSPQTLEHFLAFIPSHSGSTECHARGEEPSEFRIKWSRLLTDNRDGIGCNASGFIQAIKEMIQGFLKFGDGRQMRLGGHKEEDSCRSGISSNQPFCVGWLMTSSRSSSSRILRLQPRASRRALPSDPIDFWASRREPPTESNLSPSEKELAEELLNTPMAKVIGRRG